MSRISRLLLGVATTLALAAPSQAADVPNALPAETEQVFFVNVRQIIDSEVMKKFALGQVKQALKQNDAQKALEELGLDPLKDIDHMFGGFWGKDPENMDAVMVMTGKFDEAKLIAAAEKAGKDKGDKIAVVEEDGKKLMKMTNDKGKPAYAAVANKNTIIAASDKKLVVAGMKAVANNSKPNLSKDLAALVLKQDEKASMWLAGITEGKFGEVSVPEIPGVDSAALKKSLSKMNNLALTVNLGEDVNLSVTMGMKDADAADEFNVSLGKLIELGKTFLPLAGMNAPQAKSIIDDLVKTMKSDSKDKDVKFSLKISANAIAKAAEGAGKE